MHIHQRHSDRLCRTQSVHGAWWASAGRAPLRLQEKQRCMVWADDRLGLQPQHGQLLGERVVAVAVQRGADRAAQACRRASRAKL